MEKPLINAGEGQGSRSGRAIIPKPNINKKRTTLPEGINMQSGSGKKGKVDTEESEVPTGPPRPKFKPNFENLDNIKDPMERQLAEMIEKDTISMLDKSV